MKEHLSDQQFNEELNDKLNQLWTGAANKRRELIKNKTPSYSRRTDFSDLNLSQNQLHNQKQVFKIRDKLANQVSVGKHKDIEIQNLKKVITQLSNDKRLLINELQNIHNSQPDENNSNTLNESSIEYNNKTKIVEGQRHSANFSTYKKKKTKKQRCNSIVEEQSDKEKDSKEIGEDLNKLSKQRLIQLLRSTAEYRSFVFYYDSHELSYLKRLNSQHNKNCLHSASEKQKVYWAPQEIMKEMKELNQKQQLGLSEFHQEQIISKIKYYYERNEQERIKKIKNSYEQKMKRAMRENQNSVPYDLIQICKAKERQLAKNAKKRNNTTK